MDYNFDSAESADKQEHHKLYSKLITIHSVFSIRRQNKLWDSAKARKVIPFNRVELEK